MKSQSLSSSLKSSPSRGDPLSPLRNFRHDASAGVVVFLVALPLCLGIALASGAPLFSGLVAGIVGGLVVSWLSGSPLAVSGPAAGLTVIVLDALARLGSFEAFLLAVLLAGILQIVLGFVRAGIIAYYFPSSVIKGLLAAIGLILILKQIPHAVGYSGDYEGDMSFEQLDGRNTLTEITYALDHLHPGAMVIAAVGLFLLIVMAKIPRLRLKWLPAPLVVVVVAVVLNETFRLVAPGLTNDGILLVQIPNVFGAGWQSVLRTPDFSRLFDPAVHSTAVTLAIVASIETLLCIEAMDRIDPFRRSSDADRELRAQGVGNALCGLVGGLPITAVIVRGSANVQSGGRTRMASFVHGVLLVASILLFPDLLNQVPLAALAAVLLHIGYRLSPPSLWRAFWRQGTTQFVPFAVTVLAILFTDLLIGVAIGMATGIFFILRANLQTPYFMHRREAHDEVHDERRRRHITIELSENLSFLNKASVGRALQQIPEDAFVEIDGSRSLYIDRDVLEIIHEFSEAAPHRGIEVVLRSVPPADAPAAALIARRPLVIEDEVHRL